MDWGSCGNLSSALENIPDTTDRVLIIKQVLQGVEYLHGRGITHRDIKPDNILVMDLNPPLIKLIDFGLSSERTLNKTFCGTLPYIAPEAVARKTWYDERVDVWSVGLIGFELLVKPVPIDMRVRKHQFAKEQFAGYNRMHEILDRISGDRDPSKPYVDLLKQMIQWDAGKRPSATTCLAHLCFSQTERVNMPTEADCSKRQRRLFGEISERETRSNKAEERNLINALLEYRAQDSHDVVQGKVPHDNITDAAVNSLLPSSSKAP